MVFSLCSTPAFPAPSLRSKSLFPIRRLTPPACTGWRVEEKTKIFDKYGLDVELVFMGASSLILQSMLSGSANLAGFAGPAIVSNVLKGGDVITVAATSPITISSDGAAEHRKVEEPRRGKKIGISRLGAVPHFAIQLILERFNVKDAVILQMGGQPEAAAGLAPRRIERQRCCRCPTRICCRRKVSASLFGHHDYTKFGIRFLSGGVAARRSYASRNRDARSRALHQSNT